MASSTTAAVGYELQVIPSQSVLTISSVQAGDTLPVNLSERQCSRAEINSSSSQDNPQTLESHVQSSGISVSAKVVFNQLFSFFRDPQRCARSNSPQSSTAQNSNEVDESSVHSRSPSL
jgi:hypothetical protein